MANHKKLYWQETLLNAKERLQGSVNWFPYPAIISFFLCLLFIGQLLLGLNPRLGNPAQTIYYPADKAEEGSIWISVSTDQDALYVTTGTRRVFTISSLDINDPQLNLFIKYIKKRLESLSLSVTLSKRITHAQSIVSIAVDHGVTYKQMRPIIFALSKCGISEYAFETKQPGKDDPRIF